MKTRLIRLFFRLINGKQRKVNAEGIKKWLADTYDRQGFMDYITKRDLELLQTMGNGVKQEDYLRLVGQRLELGKLLTSARWECEQGAKGRKKKQVKIIKLWILKKNRRINR